MTHFQMLSLRWLYLKRFWLSKPIVGFRKIGIGRFSKRDEKRLNKAVAEAQQLLENLCD